MSKTIGIVGGMTPESTTTYYEHITRTFQKRFGDYGFPEIIIFSVSFQKYIDWMYSGRWDVIAESLTNAVIALKNSGADFAVIATNTMHKVFSQIVKESPIPIISIIDTTAEAIRKKGIKTAGLLGTRFTMEDPFYKNGLTRHGIKTLVPQKQDQEIVNDVIFNELGKGDIKHDSKLKYIEIVKRLQKMGADGVILGCTEIPLLICEKECGIPLFDTALLHAEKALNFALE